MKDISWQELDCGVAGYNDSAIQYAERIENCTRLGELTVALNLLNKAVQAGTIHRMEFALRDRNGSITNKCQN